MGVMGEARSGKSKSTSRSLHTTAHSFHAHLNVDEDRKITSCFQSIREKPDPDSKFSSISPKLTRVC